MHLSQGEIGLRNMDETGRWERKLKERTVNRLIQFIADHNNGEMGNSCNEFRAPLCEFNIEFMIVNFKLMNEARYYADIINE